MNLAEKFHFNLTLTFLIAVSIFGVVLSNFLVVNPYNSEDDVAIRNLAASSAFSFICILGIFAALLPNFRKRLSKHKEDGVHTFNNKEIHKKSWVAHHPSCRNYSSHILKIGKKKFCATCSGLLVGAIIALLGTVLWFSWNWRVLDPFVLVFVGSTAVVGGLLQSALPRMCNGIARFFGSIVLVLGTFVMFISINEAVKSILVDFFFVALSVLWIMTKIALSQNDHQQICSNCSEDSCSCYKK